ncbi:MAG: alpha-2-macroglobulin, partial [Planctomycetota bacterium]
NRFNDEIRQSMQRLVAMQLPDGHFSWFPGGRPNTFITAYLVAGFGRLRDLGIDVDPSLALAAVSAIDADLDEAFRRIVEGNNKKKTDSGQQQNHLTSTIVWQLYGRSFFQNEVEPSPEHQQAVTFWLNQAETYWTQLPSRMSQAHVAMTMSRQNRFDIAKQIARSLRERAVVDETGMHFHDSGPAWVWHRAEIETQAMMIEVMDDVLGDSDSVRQCQSWLLRQKETHSWSTTKATADAVYALLFRGDDMLEIRGEALRDDAVQSDRHSDLVQVSVGNVRVSTANAEAGSGAFEKRWSSDQIQPSMGTVTVSKTSPGLAWGGLHWKYFVGLDDVRPHADTPLTIQKRLFVVRQTDSGEVLRPIDPQTSDQVIHVGDVIVSRLTIEASRAMEFVHLRDYRGSGTEPINVLSGYSIDGGLAIYRSTRDAAEHFFIDRLPEGTHVIESRSRVQLRGRYQTGFAKIESMYAPQYDAHSKSRELLVSP